MKLYLIERRDKNGFKETIWAFHPCKGWRVVKIITVINAEDGRIIEG